MSKMSEMSFSFSLNVMLAMSKIDQIHPKAVMLSMSNMWRIDQMHLRAGMLCM